MTEEQILSATSDGDSQLLAQAAPPPTCSYTELQLWMTAVIRHARGPQRNALLSAAAAEHFTGSPRLSPAAQINLYRRQFWLRHTSSLIEDFPGLTTHLGQARWEKFSELFLTKVAPDSRFLGSLGRLLPEFIEEHMQTPDQALCVDLAQLEWSYQQIFDASDRLPFDFSSLASLREEQWLTLKFEVNPALRLLQLRYPLTQYRRALLKQEEVAVPEASERFVIVYRRAERLWDKEVSAPCFFLLQALKSGLNLAEACEKVVSFDATFEQILETELARYFEAFGRLEWITNVTTNIT